MTAKPGLQHALERLTSLHDGDPGLVAISACGSAAIGPLRDLLFSREPSGIYEPRRRAAAALRSLQAYDVLREFLVLRREIADPVERTGEDAVINAVAREVMCRPQEADFVLFLDILRWRILAGVVEAAGKFARAEAIPSLISALAEDDCRGVAEDALRKLGRAAEPALVACAARVSTHDFESSTRHRQRRAGLELLAETGVARESWLRLRHLMEDPDARFAAAACKIALISDAPPGDKREALARLEKLVKGDDWIVANAIEAWFAEKGGRARNLK